MYKIIISGGGTGGHIFPALSIACEIQRRFPNAEILFVGAEDRMEMERVPAAGFRIVGLPVCGFDRKNLLKNFKVVWRLIKSLRMAHKIVRDFKPDIAIGVGGYASGPTLWAASSLHIPILIQEQNSFAGITNKLLGKRAARICVAYRGMGRFFPENRVVLTGNPVRKELETIREKDTEAYDYFGLTPDKPILLIIGGSLGARTINRSICKGLKTLTDAGIQVIWQTGRNDYQSLKEELADLTDKDMIDKDMTDKDMADKIDKNVWFSDFIARMDYAYTVADLVISRAGAGTLSELCLLKKAVILVPSPNVAEDHQTKNALALSDYQAAVHVPDREAEQQLIQTAIRLLGDKEKLNALSEHIASLAQYSSAERIVDEVVKLIEK